MPWAPGTPTASVTAVMDRAPLSTVRSLRPVTSLGVQGVGGSGGSAPPLRATGVQIPR